MGPKSSANSTIIIEGGAGAPSASYLGLQEELATVHGRRTCVYDRQGYGWSDDAIKPKSATQVRSGLSTPTTHLQCLCQQSTHAHACILCI